MHLDSEVQLMEFKGLNLNPFLASTLALCKTSNSNNISLK